MNFFFLPEKALNSRSNSVGAGGGPHKHSTALYMPWFPTGKEEEFLHVKDPGNTVTTQTDYACLSPHSIIKIGCMSSQLGCAS